MSEALKFIHASDLHLDQPIEGLAELPVHLKSTLVDAPYTAAQRIFDAAITEKVDFVLLAGDVLDLESAGPRALSFLMEQFERLQERKIEVYWAGGKQDHPDRWPTAIDLPSNVTTFSTSVVEQINHIRAGKTIATIFASGFDPRARQASDFQAHINDPFPIALTYGKFESANLTTYNIRYWALGGKHTNNVTEKNGVVTAYPGTAQSRNPDEQGKRGCTLCRVDANGKATVRALETDAVRWIDQKIVAAENVSIEDLQNLITERVLKISSAAREQTCLVRWQFSPTGEFDSDIRQEVWINEMTEWLEKEFGHSSPAVWTATFEIDPPKSLPSVWYEEDTMLGDYLRAVGRYQSDDDLVIGLQSCLPPTIQDDQLAGIGRLDIQARKSVLRQAALKGLEYLSVPEEIIGNA